MYHALLYFFQRNIVVKRVINHFVPIHFLTTPGAYTQFCFTFQIIPQPFFSGYRLLLFICRLIKPAFHYFPIVMVSVPLFTSFSPTFQKGLTDSILQPAQIISPKVKCLKQITAFSVGQPVLVIHNIPELIIEIGHCHHLFRIIRG